MVKPHVHFAQKFGREADKGLAGKAGTDNLRKNRLAKVLDVRWTSV